MLLASPPSSLSPRSGMSFYHRVYAAAARVGGTEAAAFRVREGRGALEDVVHIRPDEASAAVRSAAASVLRDLAGRTVEQRRDCAFQVGAATVTDPRPQFCLVRLIRQGLHINAAVAIIVRCRDEDQAEEMLAMLRRVI